jgi:hypothetical protein
MVFLLQMNKSKPKLRSCLFHDDGLETKILLVNGLFGNSIPENRSSSRTVAVSDK